MSQALRRAGGEPSSALEHAPPPGVRRGSSPGKGRRVVRGDITGERAEALLDLKSILTSADGTCFRTRHTRLTAGLPRFGEV